MERLRREIRSALGDEEYPTREQLRKIPYLTLVIRESMSLKNPPQGPALTPPNEAKN